MSGVPERVVVVGAGLAGLRTAEALRGQGYGGRLTIVGAERHLPYDRPPLSKAVLMGTAEDTTIETDWAALECELLLGQPATGLRPGVVETAAGELDFDGLVIATGATPIRLPGPGPQHVLRTIDDARALRARLRTGARVTIVGAGWIGAEVATAAAKAGCRVTVVEAADAPLATAVGAAGAATVRWYEEAGVELRCGVKVASVESRGLALADGGWVESDEVVVGIGVRPSTDWLTGSGLTVENGVVVDASLRTDMPGVVAVGDSAAWWSTRFDRRLRVEHWDTALNSPDVAATSLLGGSATYDPVPYFWSEQFGHMVQYAGHHPAGDRLVWRGAVADGRWAVCWLRGDFLVAILTVDRPRDLVQARRVIAGDVPVDMDRLKDPDVAVRDAIHN